MRLQQRQVWRVRVGSRDPTTAQSIFICTTLGADAYELPKLTRRRDGEFV